MFPVQLKSFRRTFACPLECLRSMSLSYGEAPRRKISLVRRGAFFCRSPRRGDNLGSDGSAPRPTVSLRTQRNMNHLILSISICLLALTGCSKLEKHSIDVPEGYASQTLKEFAKQADIEIVFNVPSVANVKTNAVSGRMTPLVALDLMLSGTNLVFERDEETGAYAVTAIDDSDSVASVKHHDF
ncbi:MAG: hypothetical protein ACI92G_001770 [Candidatus Pelagisphaera sp.]|jgi:hypothetical protein